MGSLSQGETHTPTLAQNIFADTWSNFSITLGASVLLSKDRIGISRLISLSNPMAPTSTYCASTSVPIGSLLLPQSHWHSLWWVDPLSQKEFSRLYLLCLVTLGGLDLLGPQNCLWVLFPGLLFLLPVHLLSVDDGMSWPSTTFILVSSFSYQWARFLRLEWNSGKCTEKLC